MFGDVWRYTGEFEVGAVHHGAFTAAFLWTHQILETIAAQTTPIVLLTCRGKREGKGGKGQKREKIIWEKQKNREGGHAEMEGKKESQVN